MKLAKRILCALLCAVLLMGLSVVALAAGSATYTLTINNTANGHTYEAYQIFSGDLTTKDGKQILSNIKWGSSIEDGDALLAAINAEPGLSALHNAADAAALGVKLSAVTSDSTTIDLFAKVVGKHLGDVAGISTNNGDSYQISGLAAGYYLVKDSDNTLEGANDVHTKYIIRVLKDETVTPKGDVPKVDKTINDTIGGTFTDIEDFDINDTVYYKWEGTLPSNLKSYDKYFYKFIDTLPQGIEFVQFEQVYIEGHDGDPIHSFYDITDTLNTNDAFPADDPLTEDVEEPSITPNYSGKEVTLAFSDLLKLYPSILPTHKIIVKYSCRVTRDALVAEPMTNSVKVVFSNNPNGEGTGETPNNDAHAFTFRINVDKYDADNHEDKLGGAEFVLYYERVENVGGTDTTVKYYAQVVTEEMVYVLDAEGKPTSVLKPETERMLNGSPLEANDIGVVYGWTTNKTEASVLDTDSNGALGVIGLDSGIYYLEETKAPAGYNLMESPVQISIIPDYTNGVNAVTVSYEVDSIPQSSNTVGVRNSSGSTLPVTGGVGTTVFYILGSLLAVAAIVILVTRRRVGTEG